MGNARTHSPPAKRPATGDGEHQVLPFRPRNAVGSHAGPRSHPSPRAEEATVSPVRDLAKYESSDAGEDNYRHRMTVNLAALLVTVVLAIAGIWLALQIAELRKNQDCVLSGRRNCMPIDVNTLKR
jgi:hypothetical protein